MTRRMMAAMAVTIMVAGVSAAAQQWQTFEAKAFNAQFDLPGHWKTSTGDRKGVPYLESESSDGSLYLFVYVYSDSSISTEDLLDQAVEDLDLDLKGEAKREEINGMDAWVAEATGRMDGIDVGMFIMAATNGDHNYVAYVFTEASRFRRNSDVMNRILDSFRPLRS